MEPKQWHWQERLDAGGAPDEACRAQLHQLRDRISYRAWLKQKRVAARSRTRRAGTGESGEDDADKRERSETAFREWRTRKSREKRENKAEHPQTSVLNKGPGKPPSLHVNTKTKRSKQASTKSDANPSKKHSRQSEAEAAAAYDAWMARVRLEDRVRRSQRRQERAAKAAQEREAHVNKWKKKLVVCAYSASCTT